MSGSKKKIEALIIGANGLIGSYLGKLLTAKGVLWKGTSCHRASSNFLKLNVLEDDLDRVFSDFKPNVVFHCANLSGGVDFCEQNSEIAKKFHFDATRKIGQFCKNNNSIFVYLSTDYIFDGTKGPYQENDAPNPLNIYGKLKLQSEYWIQEHLKKFLIVRTTNVYGWDPKTLTPNYIMNLYRTLKEDKIFHASSLLFGTPTYVEDLVRGIFELCEKKQYGIFHIVGNDFINRFQWALGASKILELDSSLVQELKDSLKGTVVRPQKSWLSNAKFKKQCNKAALHDHLEGLRLMKKQIYEYS